MIVKIKTKEGATEPLYKTSGASGCDLYALDNIMFKADEVKLVETGIFLEIPEGFEAQMVFQKVEQASFEHVKILEKTERNDGGFGSTNQ